MGPATASPRAASNRPSRRAICPCPPATTTRMPPPLPARRRPRRVAAEQAEEAVQRRVVGAGAEGGAEGAAGGAGFRVVGYALGDREGGRHQLHVQARFGDGVEAERG